MIQIMIKSSLELEVADCLNGLKLLEVVVGIASMLEVFPYYNIPNIVIKR